MNNLIQSYIASLTSQLKDFDWAPVRELADVLNNCIVNNQQVFICGNGGSAANAMHLANDFIYGLDPSGKFALNVEALPANSSVMTCLANDTGYDNVFAHQLKIKAHTDDLLIVLSGSGNSPNIINSIEQAKSKGMKTAGVLGYEGGKAKAILDIPIHFAVNDMQISEDLQLIVGHMLMRHLNLGRDLDGR